MMFGIGNPMGAIMAKGVEETNPDLETIENIKNNG